MDGWIAGIGVVMLLACGAAAAEVEDARFTLVHDKDHPVGFAADFADRESWEKRAEFLRHQVQVAMGLWPMPPKSPLNAVIHGKIDKEGYTIEKVYFASLPGHYVTGNLYRPTGKTGKLPGVLAPYGHWPDGRFIWNTPEKIAKDIKDGAEVNESAARSPLQAHCAMLARMGCVVFQYDMVGYCDSKKIEHRTGFLDADAILRLQSFMGLQTWNSVRAMDFLLTLPEVDAKRIAVEGASSGATQTIMLCAVDSRPAMAFPVVMVSMNMQGGCVCENAPLLRVGTNNVELMSLFAPKPAGMAAAKDWTRDFDTRGLPEMKRVYGLYRSQDDVEGKVLPYGHNFNLHSRVMLYHFLNKRMKLGEAPDVKEKEFEPLPPAELSVWDATHPQPADAADAAGVRKWMTRASEMQLRALSADAEAYAKFLRTALEAMVVDSPPLPADVEVLAEKGPLPTSGGGTWSGLIGRKGSGERVPCVAVFPKDWKGAVVVWANEGGCASVTEPAAQKVLDRGAAILAVEPFMSANFRSKVAKPPLPPSPPPPSTRPNSNPPYAGYRLGYNRSVLAERTHDLMTAIALARRWEKTRSVSLGGFGEMGPPAMLARALADENVERAAIDLKGFDFDRVSDDSDPMLMPGVLKYGGMLGFAPLCSHGQTLVCNVRRTDLCISSPPGQVTIEPVAIERGGRDAGELIEWLLK